jgi:hypothetical protein
MHACRRCGGVGLVIFTRRLRVSTYYVCTGRRLLGLGKPAASPSRQAGVTHRRRPNRSPAACLNANSASLWQRSHVEAAYLQLQTPGPGTKEERQRVIEGILPPTRVQKRHGGSGTGIRSSRDGVLQAGTRPAGRPRLGQRHPRVQHGLVPGL